MDRRLRRPRNKVAAPPLPPPELEPHTRRSSSPGPPVDPLAIPEPGSVSSLSSLEVSESTFRCSVANVDQNKEKIRHILQYYYDRGENASRAANKICAVYGPDTVSISTAQRWFQIFRSGVEVVEDAPRSGRPVVENCDKIAELVERHRQSSSRSIARELGMSHQTVINHLKKLGATKKLSKKTFNLCLTR
ncbi:histone-lysine N-methyltransferase SETMAR [Drosophila biarmipes]|uniref:histone-lysine N-methyltransferase SETMAR n=1 Tax=Drosophila biarmipes TaxID=125945 RepID=UPI0007E83DF9|nr:histone-lysine N-methyltransferase SETMAR [Drosophila biarmipes]